MMDCCSAAVFNVESVCSVPANLPAVNVAWHGTVISPGKSEITDQGGGWQEKAMRGSLNYNLTHTS